MNDILPSEILYQVKRQIYYFFLFIQIFSSLRQRELRLCACVCWQWNHLISDCKKLLLRKDSIDPYDSIRLEYSFGENDKGRYSLSWPSAICTMVDRIIVCDSANNRMQVFDKRGKFIQIFGSMGDGPGQVDNPNGVCIVNGYIWVTEMRNARIQVFDGDYNYVSTISVRPFTPRSICTTVEGEILITTYGREILILDGDGHIKSKFTCQGNDEDHFPLVGICTNSQKQILVVDFPNGRVQVFDQRGMFLHALPKDSNITIPYHICVDWQDNIYITCFASHKIYILDPKGNIVQEVGVENPGGICLFGREMIVTSGHHSIVVFSNFFGGV